MFGTHQRLVDDENSQLSNMMKILRSIDVFFLVAYLSVVTATRSKIVRLFFSSMKCFSIRRCFSKCHSYCWSRKSKRRDVSTDLFGSIFEPVEDKKVAWNNSRTTQTGITNFSSLGSPFLLASSTLRFLHVCWCVKSQHHLVITWNDEAAPTAVWLVSLVTAAERPLL